MTTIALIYYRPRIWELNKSSVTEENIDVFAPSRVISVIRPLGCAIDFTLGSQSCHRGLKLKSCGSL